MPARPSPTNTRLNTKCDLHPNEFNTPPQEHGSALSKFSITKMYNENSTINPKALYIPISLQRSVINNAQISSSTTGIVTATHSA